MQNATAPPHRARPTTAHDERTAAKAVQLVAASARTSFDPFTEIDWAIAHRRRASTCPPE